MVTPKNVDKEYRDTILDLGHLIADLTVEKARTTMPRWVRPFIDSAVRYWAARLAVTITVQEMGRTNHQDTHRLVVDTVERMKGGS